MQAGWIGLIGAVIGFLGALIVSLLNNRENTKRQERQMQHDLEQRQTEREKSLEREVYLGAIEAVAKWQECLVSIADTNISADGYQKMIEGVGQQVGKVYLVGTSEALKEINKLNLFFSENAFALLEKKFEVVFATQKILELQSELKGGYERGEQFLSAAKIASESESVDITPLLTSFGENQRELEKLQDSLSQSIQVRDQLTLVIFKEASRVANEFAVLSVDALIHMRRALGMNTTDSFEKQLREDISAVSSKIFAKASEWSEKMAQKYISNHDLH